MRKFLYIVGTILITLLIFRTLAECKFSVSSQKIPIFEQNKNTVLYQATNKFLMSKPKDSDFFVPLSDPHTALISRIQLINSAESSIDVQYYLFHADDVGDALLAAIINAANRGVSVRLLIDGMCQVPIGHKRSF